MIKRIHAALVAFTIVIFPVAALAQINPQAPTVCKVTLQGILEEGATGGLQNRVFMGNKFAKAANTIIPSKPFPENVDGYVIFTRQGFAFALVVGFTKGCVDGHSNVPIPVLEAIITEIERSNV